MNISYPTQSAFTCSKLTIETLEKIFSLNDSPSKTMKNVLFHQKSSVHSQDIQVFVIFSLPFYTFQIQKNK